MRSFFTGEGWAVAPVWRLFGALACVAIYVLLQTSQTFYGATNRFESRLIDQWQRFAPPDEPSGEVIVVGIDGAAIREKTRWPWSRTEIAKLVELIVAAEPRSITLDLLLTETDAYSDTNLFRMFRQNAPEVINLRAEDPDLRLAKAIGSAPVALAVAGGARSELDGFEQNRICSNPEIKAQGFFKPHYIECLLYPLPIFDEQASGEAIAFAEQDLDGVLRRARAFTVAPFLNQLGEIEEIFLTSMPLAALTVCADADPRCPTFDPSLSFIAENADTWGGYRLPLMRAENAPPPAPMTRSFAIWLDFGALPAMSGRKEGVGADEAPHSVVSAAALFQGDQAEIARLTGKHVLVGLTRIGDSDRHSTPLAQENGAPGVVIQALAADNLISGRVLSKPPLGEIARDVFIALIAIGALLRFGLTSVAGLTAVGVVAIAAPIAVSWLLFSFMGVIYFGVTSSLAAFVGVAPVLFGRISAIRRDLANARESSAREEERMDAARQIQLGSLPFDADFTEDGFETASICRPAQEVGGDFFELFSLTDGRLFAAVGDVSGKGLEASLVTALSKSISGAVTDRVDGPLGRAFAEVSREFIRQAPVAWRREKGGFVTLVAARIDPATGEAELACAGCEPPTVISASGDLKPVELPSVAPLGWIEDAAFETASIKLAPGDTIVMFTDGVTEAETPSGALFGQEFAEETAAGFAPAGAQEVTRGLEAAVLSHQAGGAPTDDTTILSVTWRGPPGA